MLIYEKKSIEEANKMNSFEYKVLKGIKWQKLPSEFQFKYFFKKKDIYIMEKEFIDRKLIRLSKDVDINLLEQEEFIPYLFLELTKEGYEALEIYSDRKNNRRAGNISLGIGIVTIIIAIISFVSVVVIGILTIATMFKTAGLI